MTPPALAVSSVTVKSSKTNRLRAKGVGGCFVFF